MEIPILNIYYLLCYAWNKLDEGEKVSVGISDYRHAIDLFTRVLVNGCHHILKRGLDRGYVSYSNEYPGIKGKVNFGATINRNLFEQGKAVCEFDEFESNILQNQLLKGTLLRLTKVLTLDSRLRKEVWTMYFRFSNIDDVSMSLSQFNQVRIHRNNAHYSLSLNVCKMIIEYTSLNEDTGTYIFQDFIRNEKAMAKLFESFVRNFYQKEQAEYKVSSPKIPWGVRELDTSDLGLLPEMQTDIVLESKERKIVIDTKYYSQTVATNRFGTNKFHSNNLYQVYSYLRNLEEESTNKLNKEAEGVLLYPTVNQEYDHSYLMAGHRIRLVTVDLSRDWKYIANRLKSIVLV